MLRHLFFVALLLVFPASVTAQDDQPAADSAAVKTGWVDIINDRGGVGIAEVHQSLIHCGDVRLVDGSKALTTVEGHGVLAALKRVSKNIFSKQSFGDCELQLEFLIGKGSNSGIKMQGLYEVQLYDSHGKEKPAGTDCGGIYPHWEFRTKFLARRLTYTDEGHPPLVNAAKPAGQWQTLKIIFKAPRFDDAGKKTANARMELVELNGKVVQKDVELDSATGNIKPPRPEKASAPIMFQMDHGAVAFRNVRVLRVEDKNTEAGNN